MRVKLLHFASFREAAACPEEARELSDGASVRDLWEALVREKPRFRDLPTIPPAAVNSEYAGAETVLRDGDEVAFLPPVAGG